MTHARVVCSLLAGTAVGFAAAASRWRGAETPIPNAHPIDVARVATAPIPDSLLDDAADATITNDPFRVANEPAAVRYDPSTESGAQLAAPPLIRPLLVLKAIVGGPP